MLTGHSSATGSSGSATGGNGQDPNEPRQEVSHLALVISDDDEFTEDPHQIITTEDAFALPFLPRQNLKGFNWGYHLPAEVTAFQGIYYHESGDVRPGCTGGSLWDFPLDHQGHVATKLHSGVAAYSSYIRLVLTGIVYPQQEDPDVKIDQYNYFDIIGTVPSPTNHGIWGCLHYLPLISNVLLAQYDSGTFLSYLTDGGYGFNAISSTGINMYQMCIVAPMVKGGVHYIRVGLIYKLHGLFAGNIKRCSTFLRTFFDRCESEIDVARQTSFKRGGCGASLSPHAILDLC